MSLKLIEERIKKFEPRSKLDEKNALREVIHEIALSSLARNGFFQENAFIGGSCLRVVHGLKRFSEDLDFWTLKPSPHFHWKPFLQAMKEEFEAYAFHMVIEDREAVDDRLKRGFLKQNSIGKILTLNYARKYTENEKLQIRFEIDTCPPEGFQFETQHLQFPFPFSFTTLDKPSLFASKVAAILDRSHEKGRHWFDFLWYITQKWPINFGLLSHAMHKQMDLPTLIQDLATLIRTVAWDEVRKDVQGFISLEEQETLTQWGIPFFLGHLEALAEYLQPPPTSIAALIAEKKESQLMEQIRIALQRGSSVNDHTRNGYRPLQMAISKGYLDLAKLLIEHGADINYRDQSGLTPLQTAVNHGHFGLGRWLIQKGATFHAFAPNLAFDQQKLDLFHLSFEFDQKEEK